MKNTIAFGMGCFWGAQKRLQQISDQLITEVGYANGDAEQTDYGRVLELEKLIKIGLCDEINHAEVVLVTYDSDQVNLIEILATFWQAHDPTQINRQGNDTGTNYRSGIYYSTEEQKLLAQTSLDTYPKVLESAGSKPIATEIELLKNYNRAEEYHQEYLLKNPNGYCGLGGLGINYPI